MHIRKDKKVGLSIKYKLLLLLIVLPVLTLGLYLTLAINLFESDKIAYVFDSSAAVAKTLSAEVHAEINSAFSTVKPILEGLNLSNTTFDRTAQNIFHKEEGLKWLSIYKKNPLNGRYQKIAGLNKKLFLDDEIAAKETAEKACRKNISLSSGRTHEETKAGLLLAGVCEGQGSSQYAAIFLVESISTYEAFLKTGIYQNYLIDRQGREILGPDRSKKIDFSGWSFIKSMADKELPLETQEAKTADGNIVIASYSKVSHGDLYVISFIDKTIALEAVKVLLRKSVLFLLGLLCCAVIISVIASSSLTAALRELAIATESVAEGNFDIRLSVRSTDEVGVLSRNFNSMASEVSRLMKDNISKARMEKELETAKAVQETLLPPSNFNTKHLQISGSYEPASECGGDWWYYCEKDSKIFLWIGDVTGHGAPAAMITSAAKSAATIIETVLKETSPARALEILNQAVYHTAKGQIQMTFFVATFDQMTGELVYANASHDVPFLIKKKTTKLSKQDFVPLNGVNNRRLGESLDTKYDQTQLTVDSGDMILFYTDGLLDLMSPAGQIWGERNFIKSAITSYTADITPEVFIAQIKQEADNFRQQTPLLDDVTFFACKYEIQT